jgi:hypothetical protein
MCGLSNRAENPEVQRILAIRALVEEAINGPRYDVALSSVPLLVVLSS